MLHTAAIAGVVVNDPRTALILEILERAGLERRRVFGFQSGVPSCEEMPKRGVPERWDWICVEGDPQWTALPKPEQE